ncbi:MAG: arginase [Clostridium sp.]|uniref:arginase n=1 Tax=Clostridium sp. TaxID=1506 RepID=UPI00303238BC
MDINLIGVPLYYGCDRVGVENGPNVLREHGMKTLLENERNKVYDLGNLYVDNTLEKQPFEAGVNAKYINEIIDVTENLAHKVYGALSSGGFPMVIGGDHALATGSIAGVARYYPEDLGVIWIDAHGDINTFETSPSGNVHGMPLAASMGVGDDSLTSLYFNGIKVKKENVFIIGARDLDEGELELIEDLNLTVWTMDKVKELGIDKVCEELNRTLSERQIKNIHLSFDIDSIDPTFIKGTGTPVPDGINLEGAEKLLTSIFETRLVKSMDFVEFNPRLDESVDTLQNCLRLIKKIGELV